MGLFNGYCCLIRGQYRSQFEQSLAVVRVGWKFQVFFLSPAAPGGALPLSEANSDSEWHAQFDHRFHLALSCASMVASVAQKAACRDSFGNPASSLQQAIVRFR